MTLKQDRLVREILNPENKTLMEAGIKAGYKMDKGNRIIYRKSTKKHITQGLNEVGITKDSMGKFYKDLIDLCVKKGDLSTAKAAGDSLAKLNKLLQDNNIVQSQGIITEDTIARIRGIMKR